MKREMKIVPYSNQWDEQYIEIKEILLNIFKDNAIDIQHFGSTAIKGMPSKPIIDVMVIVKDISKVDEFNADMVALGYNPRGENGIVGRRYFQKIASDGITHLEHIHCYEATNSHVVDELLFRDYLRINKDAFEKYMTLKLEASEKYRFEPEKYSEFKSQCVSEILELAKVLSYDQTINLQ